ncbi:MAG: exodeoxyribonuclease VII large subunit [Bacillus subtilis]|nr:exodeoxyribonuclease VII large subunit [Bacillus subtilis]
MADKLLHHQRPQRVISKAKVEKDDALQRILASGRDCPISNAIPAAILYFSLKDEQGANRRGHVPRRCSCGCHSQPKDGDKVQLEGRVSVYEGKRRKTKCTFRRMNLDGIGEFVSTLRTTQRTAADSRVGSTTPASGRFPNFPKSIGVITSSDGRGDSRYSFIFLSRRYPLARVLVYPALVQGVEAKFSIKQQIEKANVDRLADVLIVGRGGDSIEDLWAFNEEIVLKAILDSAIPIISAVGHETDNTLADYVADLRAPTPSGAAELVVPDQSELKLTIRALNDRIRRSVVRTLSTEQRQLEALVRHNVFREPHRLLERKIVAFDHISERLEQAKPDQILARNHERLNHQHDRLARIIRQIVDMSRSRQQNVIGKLEAMSPLQVLKQGYTLVHQDDRLVSRAAQLSDTKDLEHSIL